MKNSDDFNKIWNLIKNIDYVAGTFLFETPKKLTWKERYFSFTSLTGGTKHVYINCNYNGFIKL